MQREYERAINRSTESGRRSPLAWLFAVVGLFVILGIGGAYVVTGQARRAVERITHRVHTPTPETAATRLVQRLEAHEALLSARPAEGMRFLRTLASADPSDDFVKTLVDARGEARPEQAADAGQDGASLVLGSDRGQVRLSLKKTDSGGYLAIESPDGNARIDLVRTDDGGYLTIDSDDGNVRFDLTRAENGGLLTVHSDDGETLRLGFGESSAHMPGWVPMVAGIPEPPRPVYSLDTPDGELGAVSWQADLSIEEILSFYKDRLEGEGYDLQAEHRLRDTDHDQGSLWAHDEDNGRVVFVAAHRVDGVTNVLLGYGEER
jgi:hypothetical protein